nr:MAG TPA: antigen S-antigen protein [Caudoviricetes sp.]
MCMYQIRFFPFYFFFLFIFLHKNKTLKVLL